MAAGWRPEKRGDGNDWSVGRDSIEPKLSNVVSVEDDWFAGGEECSRRDASRGGKDRFCSVSGGGERVTARQASRPAEVENPSVRFQSAPVIVLREV